MYLRNIGNPLTQGYVSLVEQTRGRTFDGMVLCPLVLPS